MALVKYNNRSILNVTAFDSIASGGLNLITTNTISSGVSSSSFTSNIDSTYDTYLFKFINLHFSNENEAFFLKLRDGGSSFDATKTTTHVLVRHRENDATSFSYDQDRDLAQSTGGHFLNLVTGNQDDGSLSGDMFLFAPSSTTFVKHFIARTHNMDSGDNATTVYTAGYANVTAAIDGVEFSASAGTIDSGIIKMYGLSKS
tara:strand:+ start:530 stop:1135 length:606 start_codon:yes stop_codon:yes gene_type:complete